MVKFKLMGRTWEKDGVLWLALSASGVEFTFTGTRLQAAFLGDQNAELVLEEPLRDKARMAVYIDGKRTETFMMTKKRQEMLLWESEREQTITVKILKISEAPMSLVGIEKIWGNEGSTFAATPDKKHCIEIIGDSITCGFGIDDPFAEHSFQTCTEDATKAYGYRTAELLDADYSLVSYSGYGIVSGYTPDGNKTENEILPHYYEMTSHSNGCLPGGERIDDVAWDFSRFQPEVVVINLGTNDDFYTQDIKERQDEYQRGYAAFLKKVRKNNPDAHIICTLGLMGDRLYPFLEAGVADYQNETKDEKVSTMYVTPQQPEDGYSADYHPSVYSQERLAAQLAGEIRKMIEA